MGVRTPRRLLPRPDVLLVGPLILAAILLRFVELGSLPGVNGDEGFWAYQMSRLLRGEAVAWRTLTGNPVNPTVAAPTLLVTWLFEPAFWVLRFQALLANLMLLAVCYPWVRRRWGGRPAILALIGFACSPMMIGYSRFGWDASQSVPVCFVAVCLAHDRRWLATTLTYAWAYIVHPTNIFLGPALLVLLLRNGPPPRLCSRRAGIVACIAVVCSTVGLFVSRSHWFPGLAGDPEVAAALVRARDTPMMRLFPVKVVELLNGITLFEYVAGSPTPAWVATSDWCVGALLAAVLVGAFVRMCFEGRWGDVALPVGLLLALVPFYLRTGLVALSPHFERYGQWLLAPLVLSAAVATARLFTIPRAWRVALCAWIGLGALGLWSTYRNYFEVFHKTGGLSHRTFWTGPTEPKEAAYRLIRSRLPARIDAPVEIRVEDYWPLYPIGFLAWREPTIRVSLAPEVIPPEYLTDSVRAGDFWVVNSGGPADALLRANPDGVGLDRWEILGFGDRTVFVVYRRAKAPANEESGLLLLQDTQERDAKGKR
jgi:hypothetical protein